MIVLLAIAHDSWYVSAFMVLKGFIKIYEWKSSHQRVVCLCPCFSSSTPSREPLELLI